MKRTKLSLLLMAAAVFAALVSCQNELFSAPFVPAGAGRYSDASAAPDGLMVTQGAYRSITLSWNQKPDTALYYVYRANSPLDTFVRCAETTANQFKFTATPGSTIYYKVSAVSLEGAESPQSIFIRGTSLAQPIITDITGITEASATVTWYMDNVANDTYKNSLLYTVYCYNGSAEVAQLSLDGAALAENKAKFDNLSPNAQYEYLVEAYLRGDQSASEKSDKVNAATARRMRPGAPVKLRAARGIATDKIKVSFELPDLVDIPLGDNQYEPKPVYFKIERRQYPHGEFTLACDYFGSIAKTATEKKGKKFDEIDGYMLGATVTWTDNTVRRGQEYEYKVQAYVDETTKNITSNDSLDIATGWALSEGSLSVGKINYTSHNVLDEYVSAKLPLDFDFEPKGETYDYVVVEKVERIDDEHKNDPDEDFVRESDPLTYNEIKSYVAQMDLTAKSNTQTPGRGLYSYEVKISLKGGDKIDTVAAFDKREVSENTQPIVVDGFEVKDGYKDRFVLKWEYRENRKYELYMSDDRAAWTSIGIVNPNPDNASAVVDNNYSHPHTAGITPGLTKYFAIRPFRDIGGGEFKQGQMVYASKSSQTLGTPVASLSGNGSSYSNITVAWKEAQKADTYRIKYWYVDEGIGTAKTATANKSELPTDAEDRFYFTFSPFANISANTVSAEAAKAGKEIQVEIDALNEGLRAEVGGGEIATTSQETVKTKLVGPALLNPQASRAASPTQIEVSWDGIPGAGGYYIFRRQFNMANTAEEGSETIVYYVPKVSADTVNIGGIKGKMMKTESSERKDTNAGDVEAKARFSGSRYTFTDIYMEDDKYKSTANKYIPAYRDQQNDMAQGLSYRYYIVPIVGDIVDSNPIEFIYAKDGANKNTSIASYTIPTIEDDKIKISYTGVYVGASSAFEKEGFTIGFAQDVAASKGTYASAGNVNNGIQITWTPSAKINGLISPRYTVYRKLYNGSTWETVVSNVETTQCVDIPPLRGTTYEYVVGIANGSGAVSLPKDSYRFIERCGTFRDDKQRPSYLGYMLDTVKVQSVSRDARAHANGQFAEEIRWDSAGVKNAYSANYHWGIDGYTIFLLNRNVNNNRQWITGDDVPANSLPDQTIQSYLFANDSSNRLKVLRDYRHYFKVRSYALNSAGEKVYGPDPAPEYSIADGRNDEYVKWGARQVSADEFAAITALSIGTALNWWANPGEVPDRNWNGGHNVSVGNNNTLGYQLNMDFNNSKPYFVNISGRLHGRVTAMPRSPEEYGCYGAALSGLSGSAQNQQSTLTFTGPSDVSMYSGTVTILRMTSGSGAGNAYRVTYNGQNSVAPEPRHWRICFTFNAGNKNDFKRTRNFDWSPTHGVAETKEMSPSDKWWYPINGSRAGWD